MENFTCIMAITGMDRLGGGIARVNRLVFRSLVEAGYDVDVFALCEPRITGIDPLSIKNYHGFDNRKLLFTLSVWANLFRNRYSLVFYDHVNLAAMLAPLASVRLARYIVWLHGVEVFPPRPDFEGRLGLSFAWKRLASSAFTRQQVLGQFPQLDVQTCDLALDPLFFGQESTNISASADSVELTALDRTQQRLGDHVILCVARMSSFERYKGQDTLIAAFPQIHDPYPDAQLILVGNGDDYSYVCDLAKQLGSPYDRSIFMPGRVNHELLTRLYRSCALFAMPSTGEGFGIVFLEAMSYAKPCIGGSKDATSGVIRDQSTGLILDDPHSPTQVARAIIDLFSDPERMKNMGKQGYDLVQSRYLYTHFRERFWNVIQSPVQQPKIN